VNRNVSAPIPTDPAQLAALRARQRRTLLILAVALMAGGILILFVLKKVPPPLRILIGLSDFFTGLILLVVVRQKFGKAGSPS
jgi:uncharacterized membrane protein